MGDFNSKWEMSIKSLPSELSELMELCGGGEKILRARGDGGLQGNRVFLTQQGCHSYEPTETVLACTGPAQVQVRQSPSTEMGKWTQAPTPNSEATSN